MHTDCAGYFIATVTAFVLSMKTSLGFCSGSRFAGVSLGFWLKSLSESAAPPGALFGSSGFLSWSECTACGREAATHRVLRHLRGSHLIALALQLSVGDILSIRHIGEPDEVALFHR